jgi:hypothetical protein
MVTSIQHGPAIQMEATMASSIGTGTAQSQYDRLRIGCTSVDAIDDADVVHINVLPEDMRFAADGPRILTDGTTVPLPDNFLTEAAGTHIPYDRTLTPPLIQEIFRTLRQGGKVRYAPSSNSSNVSALFQNAGFVNINIVGVAGSTPYKGANTRSSFIIEAEKP